MHRSIERQAGAVKDCLHSFFQIETDQNGRLLFSSAAMRVRIPPRVHPAIHPGPKWSTVLFSSTTMKVRTPPRAHPGSKWSIAACGEIILGSLIGFIHRFRCCSTRSLIIFSKPFRPLARTFSFWKMAKTACVKSRVTPQLKFEKHPYPQHKLGGSIS